MESFKKVFLLLITISVLLKGIINTTKTTPSETDKALDTIISEKCWEKKYLENLEFSLPDGTFISGKQRSNRRRLQAKQNKTDNDTPV